jgi:hypothetical protein
MYGTNEKNRKSICIRKKLTGKVYAFKDKINESLCFTTHSWILYKLYAHLVFFSYSHLFFFTKSAKPLQACQCSQNSGIKIN